MGVVWIVFYWLAVVVVFFHSSYWVSRPGGERLYSVAGFALFVALVIIGIRLFNPSGH